MSSISKQLRRSRFKEINSRLRKIEAEDVRSFLLAFGYFPESHFLPGDFFTTEGLATPKNLKKIKKLKPSAREKDIPSFLLFPKSKYVVRALGIPPLKNYIHLSNFIADNWKKFRKHLILKEGDQIIPYSYPLFFEGKKRSDVGINNYKIYSEIDIPRAINEYRYCVFVDIKGFYPNIYTHALAWALDPKTKRKKERNNTQNWANNFDLATRKLYKRRTKGLLIGPYTSDLAAELLLRSIDGTLSKKLSEKKIKILGFRFKDDYALFCNDLDEADTIRKELQYILNEYHLEVNENKTKVIHTDEFENKKTWKVEIEALKEEMTEAYEVVDEKGHIAINEKELRLWLMKTQNLYETHNDEYIIKTFLGKLIKDGVSSISIVKNSTFSYPHNIGLGETYVSIYSIFSSLCKKVPSAWPLFLVFVCMCFKGATKSDIKEATKKFLNEIIKVAVRFDDSFLLIWTLYVLWRCEIKITEVIKKLVKTNYKENWLAMSFIDVNVGKYSLNGLKLEIVNRSRRKLLPLSKVVSVFGYNNR